MADTPEAVDRQMEADPVSPACERHGASYLRTLDYFDEPRQVPKTRDHVVAAGLSSLEEGQAEGHILRFPSLPCPGPPACS